MTNISPTASPSNPAGPRMLLAITTVALSWLMMQVIHETGHVLGAMITGGSIQRVVLIPWELSRTDLVQNPRPLFVCWTGPIFGAVAPVIVWLVARASGSRTTFWLKFLAGFCLIANGAYIGVGSFTHDGDAGDLLRYGSPIWTLWVFGAITVPIGFLLWHCLGPEFGFGRDPKQISWRAGLNSLTILATIILTEIMLGQVGKN